MTYLDTSALFRRFVAERGSPLVRSIVAEPNSVATAKIAYAEVYAGLKRRAREHSLPAAQFHLASALRLQSALGEGMTFAAADERLLRASEAEGLRPLNPETGPAPSGGRA